MKFSFILFFPVNCVYYEGFFLLLKQTNVIFDNIKYIRARDISQKENKYRKSKMCDFHRKKLYRC